MREGGQRTSYKIKAGRASLYAPLCRALYSFELGYGKGEYGRGAYIRSRLYSQKARGVELSAAIIQSRCSCIPRADSPNNESGMGHLAERYPCQYSLVGYEIHVCYRPANGSCNGIYEP